MSSEWDGTAWAGSAPELQTRSDDSSIADLMARFNVHATVWRPIGIKEALGVPAINRAVSFIAGSVGMISMQGYRNGGLMAEPPRLIVRPNPFEQPGVFYGQTAYCMATRGEFIWWIASRDGDGLPSALVVVPPKEVTVTENERNRMFARYEWGKIVSTRYSPANPTGQFVHVRYPTFEPFALRGEGPLQQCGAAVNVAVEAQDWAANFYASGGLPSLVVKSATPLGAARDQADPDDADAAARSEAETLRAQWVERSNNGVRVIDPGIESVAYLQPNTQGAQMLDARNASNGDWARAFGLPGSLLEYSMPGSSLTYQNVGQELDKATRVCLQPLYFEPIEQAMSDLLPRTQTARFNVKAFLRADPKTRWEIYEIASRVIGPDEAGNMARVEEGIVPGDVEFAPVLFSPPAALPPAIEMRSLASGLREIHCERCDRLVGRVAGAAELFCRHCKEPVLVAA